MNRNYFPFVLLYLLIASSTLGGVAPTHTIETSSAENTALAYSPDGKWLAVAKFKKVDLYDASTRELKKSVGEKRGDIYGVAFTEDSKKLVFTRSKDLLVWDLENDKKLHDIQINQYTFPVAVSEKTNTILTGSQDKARVWNLDTGDLRFELAGPENEPRAIAISPDGKTLVTSHEWGNSIHTWDAATGKLKKEITSVSRASAMAFSPDGKTLAVVKWPGKIFLLTPLGVLKNKFEINAANIALAISPDSNKLAIGSWHSNGNETVSIYDKSRRRVTHTLGPFKAPVYRVAFSPDGKNLAAAVKDKYVYIWELK